MIFKKVFFLISTIAVLTALFSFSSLAFENDTHNVLLKNRGGIMSVAHRGDSAFYPENSIEGMLSAFEKGADFVSVGVCKTSDGALVLADGEKPLNQVCKTEQKSVSLLTLEQAQSLRLLGADGEPTDCLLTSLEKAVSAMPFDRALIIDCDWSLKNDVFAAAVKFGAQSRLIIRTDADSRDIAAFTKSSDGVRVIGVYGGNIIFNAYSHLNRLSAASQPVVQFESKNYFNVCFDGPFTKKYSSENNARALAAMYDPDLCGQREDSAVYWDEMIKRGFSVIETDNTDGLVDYIRNVSKSRENLYLLTEECEKIELGKFTSLSEKNFVSALDSAKSALENGNTPLSSAENAFSALAGAKNGLTLKTGVEIQKGSLSVTAGKIAAAVIFGALIFAGELYVHKMQGFDKKKRSIK